MELMFYRSVNRHANISFQTVVESEKPIKEVEDLKVSVGAPEGRHGSVQGGDI